MSTQTLDVKIIKIHRLADAGKIKAFVNIGINDAILIKGVRVFLGQNGLFVSMPSELGKNERWYERVSCLTKDAQELISQKVLEAYNTGEGEDVQEVEEF